jgi:hypothetical protein
MTSKARFPSLIAFAWLAVAAPGIASAGYEASLGADSTEGSAGPGLTAAYALTLTNTGTEEDTYAIAAAPGPLGWLSWPSIAGVTLGASESVSFDVYVDIPIYSGYGSFESTVVSAMSQGYPPTHASITLHTIAVDALFTDGFENPS